ncbi:putative membrane protein [Klebsiella oxytoca]|nr:putative membrane protein [Klebsiella oxytoca]
MLGLVAQVFGVIKVDIMLIVVEFLMLGVWMQCEREKSNNKK